MIAATAIIIAPTVAIFPVTVLAFLAAFVVVAAAIAGLLRVLPRMLVMPDRALVVLLGDGSLSRHEFAICLGDIGGVAVARDCFGDRRTGDLLIRLHEILDRIGCRLHARQVRAVFEDLLDSISEPVSKKGVIRWFMRLLHHFREGEKTKMLLQTRDRIMQNYVHYISLQKMEDELGVQVVQKNRRDVLHIPKSNIQALQQQVQAAMQYVQGLEQSIDWTG